MNDSIFEVDPEVASAIAMETRRQNENLELIASENFVSEAVLEATGSVFTNKYAEGYPGKRYYAGCEFVDKVETLVQTRAKKLFGAEHVNAQPHSGTQANVAVYMTVCKPGDTILGMNLAHGGHLTHGHPLNFSGKMYRVQAYGVTAETEQIDYDELARLAQEHKPRLIVCGASAYPRIIDFARIGEIARSVGARSMADIAHIAGMVATGLHPSPIQHMDFVTTTTHKTLRGPRGGLIMCKEEFAKDVDKVVFPGTQGGPLVHVIAAKAVCLNEALKPDFAEYQRQIVANAKALANTLMAGGFSAGFRRNGQSPDAGGCVQPGHHRQGRRAIPGKSQHHGKQECDSVRQESAHGGERYPHRDSRGNDSRDAGKGNGNHRTTDRPGAARAGRSRRPAPGPSDGP